MTFKEQIVVIFGDEEKRARGDDLFNQILPNHNQPNPTQ